MTTFALLGVAGYIAPRHLRAIKEVDGNLLAACDPNDSVGVIDSYFPDAEFFTEIERFDRFLELKRREGTKLDYLVVCTPNYLHDAHCRLGLRLGMDVICEKPVTINPWNLDQLMELEKEFQRDIHPILQLRLHPEAEKLEGEMRLASLALPWNDANFHNVTLRYITARGKWYDQSWKGNETKSGGLMMNIGVHFIDLLMWIFGNADMDTSNIHYHYDAHTLAGELDLEGALVKWNLSIDRANLPEGHTGAFREVKVGDRILDLTGHFTELHTEAYRRILDGRGFSLADAKPAIEVVHQYRRMLEK